MRYPCILQLMIKTAMLSIIESLIY
uniref:Uncharacterized protein n=1 Tax=Anguilla anguilla TaxID=7936 RepID=A0A0E9RNI4_ANGAN